MNPPTQKPVTPMNPRDVDGWCDIATAPKDGTGILVWWPDRCDLCEADSTNRAVVRWKHNGWYMGKSRRYQSALFTAHQPTHWMPLPPPPKES